MSDQNNEQHFPLKGGLFKHDNAPASEPVDGHKVLPLFKNTGKTAIVSGAGAGIGLNVAQALAESGANVAIWYNSNKKALDRAAEIEKMYDVKCKAYQVNVLDPKHVQEAVDEIVKEFNGRLDIFVANSGVPWTQGPMADGELEGQASQYKKVVSTDLDGTFYCARAAAQWWKRQKETGKDLNGNKLENFVSGSFVATASMSGHIVNVPQMQAAYNAAKAGVIHLCKPLPSAISVPPSFIPLFLYLFHPPLFSPPPFSSPFLLSSSHRLIGTPKLQPSPSHISLLPPPLTLNQPQTKPFPAPNQAAP